MRAGIAPQWHWTRAAVSASTASTIRPSDDWTPAAPCKAMAAAATVAPVAPVAAAATAASPASAASAPAGTAAPPQWQAYEGAYHGFDGTAPVRLRRDVPNGVHPGAGVHVGGNPAARAAARERLDRFLRETWRLAP